MTGLRARHVQIETGTGTQNTFGQPVFKHFAKHSGVFLDAAARACHSLVVRLDKGRATGLRDRLVAAGYPMQTTDTRIGLPDCGQAQRRLAAISQRPLRPGREASLRPSLIEYDDGRCDLVLVAERARISRHALESFARAAIDTGVIDKPNCLQVTGQLNYAATAPDWGCGDPADTGTRATVEFDLGAASPEQLLAGVRLTLVRYTSVIADENAQSGSEVHTVGQYLRQCADMLNPDVCGNVDVDLAPTVLLTFDGPDVLGEYHPFLAPARPLAIHFRRSVDNGWTGHCALDCDLIAPTVATQFCLLLADMVSTLGMSTAERSIDEVLFKADAGVDNILQVGGFGGSGSESPEGTIVEAFSRVRRDSPEACAVSDRLGSLSYRELDEQSDQLASALAAAGVNPGGRVGVCVEPDRLLVATLLAVLKVGCAYVPIDVRYPQERIAYIVENAGLSLVVGQSGTVHLSKGVAVMSPTALLKLAGPKRRLWVGGGTEPAYVVYTSGSTGRPKGVVVPHRNVLALVQATRSDLEFTPLDVWTLFHSSAFDFSVWEMWGCLLTGGRLFVVDHWLARSPDEFHAMLVKEQVTVINQTPSAFAQLIPVDWRSSQNLSLRLVILGGEHLHTPMLVPWFVRHPVEECRVVNMFGITETTVHVTSHTVDPHNAVQNLWSVGNPLPGWWVSVRDRAGRIMPLGCSGEIYVGGSGVASNYVGLQTLTAQRFLTDSYTGERVYRSGDVGRLRPGGGLDHLGRLDNQVKMRGYRIELEEIRSVLLGSGVLIDAAVAVRETIIGDPATARIEAYMVLQPGKSQAVALRHMHANLPDYMIPTVIQVPDIPRTFNGKVDFTRLTPRDPLPLDGLGGSTAHGGVENLNDLILGVWRAVLGSDCGVGDNFFHCGGNSLLAVRILEGMRVAGLTGISARDLYRNPTVLQLAELAAAACTDNQSDVDQVLSTIKE